MTGEAGAAAASKAKIMLDWALAEGVMVIHSLADIESTPPPNCRTGERLKGLLAKIAASPGAEDEVPELAYSKAPREYVVKKRLGVISGLSSQAAQDLLAEHDIKTLLICGISTSNAVLRTAVPATDNGFVVCVIGDACTDPDRELHEVVMGKLLPHQAYATDADKFVAEWRKAKSA